MPCVCIFPRLVCVLDKTLSGLIPLFSVNRREDSSNFSDCMCLQDDLKGLEQWSTTWSLPFNNINAPFSLFIQDTATLNSPSLTI